jgi:hypothetical protein
MAELSFECIGAEPDKYGVSPTLLFKLRITDPDGQPVHAIALRCQVRIEPQRRRYDEKEGELLGTLFGDRSRWGDTLKPIQFALLSVMVPSFTGSTEIDVPVPCTYDMDVTAGSYFHALQDGVVPLVFLFSGTIFGKGGEKGFSVSQVPWHQEASFRLPIKTWKEMMDRYFPETSWLRVRRDTLDALLKYNAVHALPGLDAVITSLLEQSEEKAL